MNNRSERRPELGIYTAADLARDLGLSVSPALERIVTNVFSAEIMRWMDRWESKDDGTKARHEAEVANLKEQLAEAAYRANQREEQIETLRRELFRLCDPSVSYLVTAPYAGLVPAVLDTATGPLFRIRWEPGLPSGEGEPWSVKPGFVLCDDQSGTWLDQVNTRHCTGL
jgi:hypothetical protein